MSTKESMSSFSKEEDAFIFNFLRDASQPDTLALIKAEVEGRGPKNPRSSEEEEEESDEEDEEEDGAVKRRKPSKTLMGLLEAYFDACPPGSTHHTCLVLFVKESMTDLDPGGSDKKHLDWLEPWLIMLQKIIEASNVLNAATKNFFSAYTSVAQQYFRNLPDEDRRWSPLVDKWREIIKVSQALSLVIMQRKDEVLAKKLGDKFTMDFDQTQAILRRYKREADAGSYDRKERKKQITQLAICCISTGGMRKTALLDPFITFQTIDEFMEEKGIDETSDFRFGTDTSKLVTTTDKALSSMGKEFLFVQTGVLKSKGGDRYNQYKDDTDDFVGGTVVKKPSIIFTGEELCEMVDTIREHFDLTMETRATDKKARARLGGLLSSRDITPILKKDFSQNYEFAHEPVRGYRIAFHHFRKFYANASYELIKDRLYSVLQRRVDKLVWMAQVLAHQGSWQTAQSYNTVVVEFSYTNETIRAPDAQMLRLVLEEVKSLRAECHGMRDEINELTVALAKVSEDEPKERNAPHKKREMNTVATSQEDLDDRIRDALWELKEKGVPENKRRYPDGTNRSRCLEYEKRKRAAMQSLLPNDFVQRKNRAANIEQKEMHKKRKHIRTPVEPDPMRDYSKQPEG
jgi:hypothetical protein